eukprot:7548860-Pyramimonas_sp.AAC.1
MTDQPNHFAIHWGWAKGAGISNACGVSVMLNKSMFNKNHIRHIFQVPKYLWGRVGAVNIERGSDRFGLILAYFPPKPSATAKRAQHMKTVERILAFIHNVISQMGHRYLPFIFTDLNDTLQCEEPHIGAFVSDRRRLRLQANLLPAYLQAWDMQAVNTHANLGDTWFGARGESSQIDYLFAPLHLPGVQSSCLLHYSARRLQLHNSVGKWDHIPIQFKFEMPEAPLPKHDISRQISKEAMSAALQRGWLQRDYIEKVEAKLGSLEQDIDKAYEDTNLERIYDCMIGALNSSAAEIFTTSPYYTEDHKERLRQQADLLQQR